MDVKIAKNAGFCFGVKRAMKMAWNELEKNNESMYALGPLIHNKQAVEKYEEKGLKTVDIVNDIPENKNMIIRSHGVSESVYKDAKEKEINIIDTTCPFVKKIHDIVSDYHKSGHEIIVIGDMKHPEVIGINGWCDNSAIIIKTIEQLEEIDFDSSKKYCVVSQTTMNLNLHKEITNRLSAKLKSHVVFYNTICSATKERQEAAKKLSREVDCMVVVGGKHSSNTQKLVNICEELVPTFAIETKEELISTDINKFAIVGITAGASTPDWIISDVVEYIKSL